jgi:hypothetical protein
MCGRRSGARRRKTRRDPRSSSAGGLHADQLALFLVRQFVLLAAQLSLGAGDGHALTRAQADQIGLELGKGGKDVEEHPAHRIGRVMHRDPQCQPHAARLQLGRDGAGIRNQARQPVQLGHHQRIARPHRRQRLGKDGPVQLVPVRPASV